MLTCRIVSPQKMEYNEKLDRVIVPAYRGEMEILTGHAEMFVLLRGGNIELYGTSGENKKILIDGGQCHIKKNEIVIIL